MESRVIDVEDFAGRPTSVPGRWSEWRKGDRRKRLFLTTLWSFAGRATELLNYRARNTTNV